jgi:dienelactone hydrolase
VSLIRQLWTAVEVLRETWRLPRAPANRGIFDALARICSSSRGAQGFDRYLDDYPALGQITILRDWYKDETSGEMRLLYSNSLFADGCLRLKIAERHNQCLVFLPGNQTGAHSVLGTTQVAENMTEMARALGLDLACWDWPLQGGRKNGCLYLGLSSLYSAEREYSRILPAIGSCLWREYVGELQFALAQITRCLGKAPVMHIVGWSMGGYFAYIAPLLNAAVRTAISAGSCAATADLLAEGKTRVHGYFFYPTNGKAYFDLKDILAEALRRECCVSVIYGENDQGCLQATSTALRTAARQVGQSLDITILPNHGHVFSRLIKAEIQKALSTRLRK